MQQHSKVKTQDKRLYLYILLVLILSSLIGFTATSAVAANQYGAPQIVLAQATEINLGCDSAQLISAINQANSSGIQTSLNLAFNCNYILSAVDNSKNGPN